MTEEENIINMRRCPRFRDCSIPKCPLDYWALERTELPEDEQCSLYRLLVRGKHKKRIKGTLTPKMRGLFNFIPNINKKSDKVA